MDYGYWLSKRGNFHTLRECRHHGLQEFCLSSSHGRPIWNCLECKRQWYRGVRTGKIAGCSNVTGIAVAEMVLSKAFKVMKKAPYGAPFDFYCGKNLKIDSKCATLGKIHGKEGQQWHFMIRKNKVPDAFCLIALDNLPGISPEDAKPIHVWLIRGDAIIDGRPLNERESLAVAPRTISRLEPWRRTDMEGRIIKCCNNVKESVPA